MTSKLDRLRPIIEMLMIGAIGAILYWLVLQLLPIDVSTFVYAPLELYGYFMIASIVILVILIVISFKDRIYVGNSFLLLTFVKMGYAYLLLRPVLEQNHRPEKINFFFIFALFLTFETIVTGRMLNRK